MCHSVALKRLKKKKKKKDARAVANAFPPLCGTSLPNAATVGCDGGESKQAALITS